MCSAYDVILHLIFCCMGTQQNGETLYRSSGTVGGDKMITFRCSFRAWISHVYNLTNPCSTYYDMHFLRCSIGFILPSLPYSGGKRVQNDMTTQPPLPATMSLFYTTAHKAAIMDNWHRLSSPGGGRTFYVDLDITCKTHLHGTHTRLRDLIPTHGLSNFLCCFLLWSLWMMGKTAVVNFWIIQFRVYSWGIFQSLSWIAVNCPYQHSWRSAQKTESTTLSLVKVSFPTL